MDCSLNHHNHNHNNHHHHNHHHQMIKNHHRTPTATAPSSQARELSHCDHQEMEPCQRSTGFKLFVSECLATFVLVYLSQAGTASFELTGTPNDTIIRQLAIIITYGLAFMLATLMALNLTGAHLNPAYSFASALFGYIPWRRALIYMGGQYLGSFLAAIFLHATYSDKLSQRHTEGLLTGMNSTLRAHGNVLSTGKLFSSYPPTEVSLTQLIISYILAAAHLMLLLLAVHESKLVRIPRSLRPLYLASAMCLILAAFSANGGPVVNPAQDFSPRLYISISGWGSSAFNLYQYRYWWLCGLMAPHLGALIGFAVYQILIHLNHDGHHHQSGKSDIAENIRRTSGHDEHNNEYNALTRENEPF